MNQFITKYLQIPKHAKWSLKMVTPKPYNSPRVSQVIPRDHSFGVGYTLRYSIQLLLLFLLRLVWHSTLGRITIFILVGDLVSSAVKFMNPNTTNAHYQYRSAMRRYWIRSVLVFPPIRKNFQDRLSLSLMRIFWRRIRPNMSSKV